MIIGILGGERQNERMSGAGTQADGEVRLQGRGPAAEGVEGGGLERTGYACGCA